MTSNLQNIPHSSLRATKILALSLMCILSFWSEGVLADDYIQKAGFRLAKITDLSWDAAVKRDDLFLVKIEHISGAGSVTILSIDLRSSQCQKCVQNNGKGGISDLANVPLTASDFNFIKSALLHIEPDRLPEANPYETGLDGNRVYIEVHNGTIHWRGWRWSYELASSFPASKEKETATRSDPFAGDGHFVKKGPEERLLSLFLILCMSITDRH